MRVSQRFRKYIPILCVMLLWGSMGIPSTYALENFSPLELLCLRSGLGAFMLFPCVMKIHGSIRPAKEDRRLLLILALIGVVLCNYLYFCALERTTLTNTAILYAIGPLITAILAALFFGEHIYQSRILGIVIAFLGVAALLTGGQITQLFQKGLNEGDIAELGSAFCLASYTVLSKKMKKTSAECAVFWLMFISFAVTFLMVLLFEGGFAFEINLKAGLSVLYLGFFCSGAGYLLQQCSIRCIGAAASAAFLNGISPITVLTAGIFLHEHIGVFQICCMALVFLGLYLNAVNKTIVG